MKIASITSVIIILIYTTFAFIDLYKRNKNSKLEKSTIVFGLFYYIFDSILISVSIFLIIIPVYLILKELFNTQKITDFIANFPLYFSSFLVGIFYLYRAIWFIPLLKGRFSAYKYFDIDYMKEIKNPGWKIPWPDFLSLIRFQYSFYLISLCFGWIGFFYKIQSITLSLLYFALFFIVDDWNIIASYSSANQGRILKWHKKLILGMNWIIFFLTIITYYSFIYAYLLLTIMLVILLIITVKNLSEYREINPENGNVA
ncbi:hypothetical protein [Leptospira paudalimensis]|uniref:DUF975 family protein n=1 Tax=Leptospira paudalimensis TaxID=2950024 RepID=A0ABT3M575_9LEPT|nr:hypothetical protein [Leptospira paudalimensis]MCW7503541.1 hypothetical protein [Leptospira paudalimensis]